MLSLYLSMVVTDEERDKLTYIYENFYSAMAQAARNVMHGQQCDVDDIVHNSFLRIIDVVGNIDCSNPARAKGFCCTVARNLAINYVSRRDNTNIPLEETLCESADESCDPVEILIKKETYDKVLQAIISLDPKYRDVCILKYVNKLKEREIAKILNLAPGTVSVRIQRARQSIKNAVHEEDTQ